MVVVAVVAAEVVVVSSSSSSSSSSVMWETPPRGVALQHAPPAPAPDQSRSGRPPASASLGLLAELFWLARPHWPCFPRRRRHLFGRMEQGQEARRGHVLRQAHLDQAQGCVIRHYPNPTLTFTPTLIRTPAPTLTPTPTLTLTLAPTLTPTLTLTRHLRPGCPHLRRLHG